MKSAFGSKRKARKIQVDEDNDEGGAKVEQSSSSAVTTPTTSIPSSNPGRKAFKKSSLRQSIAFDDLPQDESENGGTDASTGPPVNKPTIGRSSSLMMKKKKPASARLSFGPGEIISGDAAEALEDNEAFTPKKATLGRRVIEGNAVRKSLPLRTPDDDEDRPTYSKDYLNELKSSTPTTPKDLLVQQPTVEDEEMLDASELEGAVIVDVDEKFGSSPAVIPSEAEIREKKERRARLAHEKDFISLNDTGDDRRHMSLLPRKKEKETRLVREDEDLGEGFDEFVDDGRVSLGRKQEREARRRHRKEMADMIHQAEGSSGEESDDSEAERRAAYEAAQTRAGMDGLHKPNNNPEFSAAQIPTKITPLPVLSECLERLQATLSTMEQELAKRQKKLEESRQEKQDIAVREAEVQELLKQAGARYAALKTDMNGAVADSQTLADAHFHGLAAPLIVNRGLESFGNTPTIRPDIEDVP
ncbi:nineteen complex-related protein 2-domain-containing protein [Hyaloscypha finlandica]|nr:nineteen complex-related protein 2-domain-containing protein [Hyaloscypha finlandica]